MNKEILKLACSIIPGIMNRERQPGYSDEGAVWEAFHIAQSIIEELNTLPKFLDKSLKPKKPKEK